MTFREPNREMETTDVVAPALATEEPEVQVLAEEEAEELPPIPEEALTPLPKTIEDDGLVIPCDVLERKFATGVIIMDQAEAPPSIRFSATTTWSSSWTMAGRFVSTTRAASG